MGRLRALTLPLCAAFAGCGTVAYAGAIGYDAGSLEVPRGWIADGIGAQVEAILYPGGGAYGLGPSAQLSGYASPRGSPITFTTLELRYHARSRLRSEPYYQLGSGAGVAWGPRVRHLAMPLQLEIGMEHDLGPALARVGVRERVLGLVGTEGGDLAVFNSLQLILGIATGGGF
jgi:hypothetical protein